MAIIDQIEYSACTDCLVFVTNGEILEDASTDVPAALEEKRTGRKGHWVTGVEPTRDDPHGSGHNEFSQRNCEICDALPGERHGITLLLEDGDGQ